MMNFVGNSVKFTSAGFIEISLVDQGQFVECSIADTGEGIAKENIPKLFHKFERIGHGKDIKIKGTGLGLYICKKFIEFHGGKVNVESEVGKGTKFIFTLPKGKSA